MPAPSVVSFGDGSHTAGDSGITVAGAGFMGFPGSVWIYENSDRSGDADELTVTSWNSMAIVVSIPGSLNNSGGTRYLFVQREDLAWSQGFEFTLTTAANDMVASGSLSIAGAADLDALGQLVAAGAVAIAGTADLDAAGQLAAAGLLAVVGAASPGAIGQLAAAGALVVVGNADLSGSLDDIIASGALSVVGLADLSALGQLVAAGQLSAAGAADLDAIGQLVASGQLSVVGAADLTAIGQLIASGVLSVAGTAELVDANSIKYHVAIVHGVAFDELLIRTEVIH